MKTLVKTGQNGEDRAAKFLEGKGYKILTRNYREKWGELDIIAKSRDKTLVFIEVKSMNRHNCPGLRPEDNMTRKKLGQVRKMSGYYANKHPELVDKLKGWRIDLIALTIDEDCCDIAHYENV